MDDQSMIAVRLARFIAFVACGIGILPGTASADAADGEVANTLAPRFNYAIDAGVGETDNVTLASTDRISQTIATADLDFGYLQATRLINADLKGDFSFYDYLQHAYASELIGRFDGAAHFAVIPEQLTWTVQDDFGQGQINAFAAQTPNNRQNIDYFATGPDLYFRLGGTTFLNASARYARAQYSDSPFNSNRYQGSVELGDRLSPLSTVSVDGDVERVLFENTAESTDFNRNSAYAHYQIQGARTAISVNFGVTNVDQGGIGSTGALGKAEVERRISPSTRLSVTIGRELTDASTGFSTAQNGAIGAISSVPASQTSNTYTSDYSYLSWNYDRNRTSFGLSGRWESDSYHAQPQLDQKRGGAEFLIAQNLTRAFSAQLLGSWYRSDFDHANFLENEGSTSYSDRRLGASLNYRKGRGLIIKLRFDNFSRAVSGYASTQPYRANTIYLTVGYRPLSAPMSSPNDNM